MCLCVCVCVWCVCVVCECEFCVSLCVCVVCVCVCVCVCAYAAVAVVHGAPICERNSQISILQTIYKVNSVANIFFRIFNQRWGTTRKTIYEWISQDVRSLRNIAIGWRRFMECLKLQVIFRKRATNYGLFWWKWLIKIICLRHPVRNVLYGHQFVSYYNIPQHSATQ